MVDLEKSYEIFLHHRLFMTWVFSSDSAHNKSIESVMSIKGLSSTRIWGVTRDIHDKLLDLEDQYYTVGFGNFDESFTKAGWDIEQIVRDIECL